MSQKEQHNYTSFPKPKKEKDDLYLKRVREEGCMICLQKADAHHLDQGGFGSDYATVPLCRMHHTEIHMKGVYQFNVMYGVDVWEKAWRLYKEYEDGKLRRLEDDTPEPF